MEQVVEKSALSDIEKVKAYVDYSNENHDYYNALEQYAVNGDLTHFADFVAQLEEQRLDEYLALIGG